jgi:hypothetical protein
MDAARAARRDDALAPHCLMTEGRTKLPRNSIEHSFTNFTRNRSDHPVKLASQLIIQRIAI